MQDQGRTDAGLSSHPIAPCSCVQCVPQDRQHPAPSHTVRLLIRAQTLSHSCPDMASTELFLLHCFLPIVFFPPRKSCAMKAIGQLYPQMCFSSPVDLQSPGRCLGPLSTYGDESPLLEDAPFPSGALSIPYTWMRGAEPCPIPFPCLSSMGTCREWP